MATLSPAPSLALVTVKGCRTEHPLMGTQSAMASPCCQPASWAPPLQRASLVPRWHCSALQLPPPLPLPGGTARVSSTQLSLATARVFWPEPSPVTGKKAQAQRSSNVICRTLPGRFHSYKSGKKQCQPGALLPRLPTAQQCGVATSWSSSKEGLPPYCFSQQQQHPLSIPRAAGVPSRLRQAAPGGQGRAALPLTASARALLGSADGCPPPAPPREQRKSRGSAAGCACHGDLAAGRRKPPRPQAQRGCGTPQRSCL